MHSKILSTCLLLTGLLIGIPATHAQLVLETSDQGRISMGPYGVAHDSSSQSYNLGNEPMTSFLGIPYFVFEIPTFAESIASVKLSIYNPADVGTGDFVLFDQGFDNNNPASEISLWNYSGDQTMFDTDFNTMFSPPGSSSIWDDDIQDLQSGTQYGSKTVDSSSDGSWIDFYLNSDALIDIWNNQGGTFAMGAKSENNNTMFYGNDLMAPGSQLGGVDGYLHPSARLEFLFREGGAVAVPEPSTYGIAGGLALGIIIAIRHQRRRKERTIPKL